MTNGHMDFLDHGALIARICEVPEQTLCIRFDEIKALNLTADIEFRLMVAAIGSLMVERMPSADDALRAQAALWWSSHYYCFVPFEPAEEGNRWRPNQN